VPEAAGTATAAAPSSCARCGTHLAPALLSCPACRQLVYAPELKRLADEAARAEQAGDLSGARDRWRAALDLLPPDSGQHHAIAERIAALTERLGTSGAAPAPPAEHGSSLARGGAVLGGLALLLWKFKFVLVFVATKAKLLVLGLTKASTFLSMLLSFGVYWTAWGWKFAAGLVLSIYVHEMGHVIALRRYGIKATAPMFIPGLGALIRLKQKPADPREEARVGLAGPLWGLGAAAAAFAVYRATGWASWGAIAKVGAWVNLLNLLPVWQLDGGHAFRSFARDERWLAAGALLAAWLFTHEGLLALLLIAAVVQAFGKPAERPDPRALALYAFLVAALSALTLIRVPGTL
jgi:Zn-dependent protease